MISNTKQDDRYRLWQNIWCQAITNGQTKQDTVTIQIPDKTDTTNEKHIEIEYTIADLESLLIGKK